MPNLKPVPCCSHCSRVTRSLQPVKVRALRGDDQRTLNLCIGCREKPGATWRLRWRVLP